jgi:hypothetical protein
VRALSLVIAISIAGCAARGVDQSGVFIALGRDFEGFERWNTFDRGFDPVPPSHDGTSVIYVDTLPEHGMQEFPIGTRIVRIEQYSEDPSERDIHAMVKRGGGYNENGADDWEFFELALDEGTPFIVWRGEGPETGDGYRPAPGATEVLGCNHCHAVADWNDSVLSPALALATF